MTESFEHKFRRTGLGGEGAEHCTYCPKRPGEACGVNCEGNYNALQKARADDGVKVTDHQ